MTNFVSYDSAKYTLLRIFLFVIPIYFPCRNCKFRFVFYSPHCFSLVMFLNLCIYVQFGYVRYWFSFVVISIATTLSPVPCKCSLRCCQYRTSKHTTNAIHTGGCLTGDQLFTHFICL